MVTEHGAGITCPLNMGAGAGSVPDKHYQPDMREDMFDCAAKLPKCASAAEQTKFNECLLSLASTPARR